MRIGLRIVEWVWRVVAGLDPEPPALTALGGVTALLGILPATLPEALMAQTRMDPADADVAAYVVEKITGERFEDYVARTWFKSLKGGIAGTRPSTGLSTAIPPDTSGMMRTA